MLPAIAPNYPRHAHRYLCKGLNPKICCKNLGLGEVRPLRIGLRSSRTEARLGLTVFEDLHICSLGWPLDQTKSCQSYGPSASLCCITEPVLLRVPREGQNLDSLPVEVSFGVYTVICGLWLALTVRFSLLGAYWRLDRLQAVYLHPNSR